MEKLAVAVALALGLAASAAQAGGEMVKYGQNAKFSAYLARPEGKGPFPATVVVHEWWGLNQNIKDAADRLAGLGYVAFAVDLFGKTATEPAEAMKLVRGVSETEATAKMLSAGDYLRSRDYVMPEKVGAIGWCFGGGVTLRYALADPKLAVGVIYYGKLVTDPKELKKVKAPLLGLFGEEDDSIPVSQVKEFDEALKKAGVPHEIYTYAGAGHAFANPTASQRYRREAAEDAWKKTTAFLGKWLKGS